MLEFLRPRATLTGEDVQKSLRMMTWEGVAFGGLFSLGSGGFMSAFALALGANNFQVGILAALPFVTQIVQLPAILAIERFRARKAVGIPALLLSNLIWIPIGAVPFLMDTPGTAAVTTVIVLLAMRGLFSPFWVTAWTSWMRDLVPQNILGSYYGRRLALITASLAVIGVGGSYFVRWWEGVSSPEHSIYAFSFLLIGGVLSLGIADPVFAARAKEPMMPPARESGRSALAIVAEPLRDKNFSQLVRFLFVWSLTSNLAIPFFAVYMLTELGLSLPVVIGFTVLSQVTNVVFVRVWGPMADHVGSKTVLSLSASLYLLVIIGWVFTAYPERHFLSLPLLGMLHIFAGIASAGVTLTVSTISLKVAPDGQATPFLGAASIATNVGAGIGPIAGGLLADYFSVRSLVFDFGWASPNGVFELQAISLTGFDFLFVLAFVTGILSLNLLVALREEGELPRDMALSELTSRIDPLSRAVSSVPGLSAASAFSYGYIKRVPGTDVALGVTAYQLAASSQVAASSVSRGRTLVHDIAESVSTVLEETVDDMEEVAEHGLELARHSTRGAVQAGGDLADELGRVVQGAVLGTLRALDRQQVEMLNALTGAGYGILQGTEEAGSDVAEAAAQVPEVARIVANELGVAEGDAAKALAVGLLVAAAASGEDTLSVVRQALPPELSGIEPTEWPGTEA